MTLQEAKDILSGVLSAAAAERPKRNTWVNGELAWVTFEREVMFDKVNELRAKLGKVSVDLVQVCRVEQSACGHSDYASKFALRCATLVLEP